ncbi:hypothetical protein SDC9_86598 [bioreactor metagenome]|uniref:N-acetyltransferase domain-containing protein n=1 Tax=bioreactor metagenome TaxID=1076179 RepID=A0A644ZJD5_9ZZZZ
MTLPSPQNISIEKVRYHDLNELEKIFTGAFGEEVDAAIIRQRIHRIRQFYFVLLPLSSVSLWLKNLFSIYICRVEGKVAGFMQVSFFNRGQLHLDYIAINKHYRGQGLGTLILRKLIDGAARNNYDIILEVRSDNPAYYLYKRLGFISQAQILHYDKDIERNVPARFTTKHRLGGFRKRNNNDWRQIYELYLKSLPLKLHQIARREIREYNPSLFTKSLEWFKNYMMGNVKQQYVLEKHGKIVGTLELQSYLKAHSHIMNVMLDHEHEYLRERVYLQALYLLRTYKRGTISTTIYRDGVEKQQALEKLGFIETEAYYLMFRPAHLQNKVVESDRCFNDHTNKSLSQNRNMHNYDCRLKS